MTVCFVLAAVLPALCVAWFASCGVRRIASTVGFLDQPSSRKDHRSPVPLGGGLALWAGVVAPLALLQFVAQQFPDSLRNYLPPALAPHVDGLRASWMPLTRLLGLATLALLLGLADDRWRLPWPWRLAIQFLLAILGVTWGGWQLTLYVLPPWLSIGLSVLWIVALVNAFNMMDNMDGLSSGCAAIASGVLMVILLWGPNPESHDPQWFLAGLSGILLGSNLGFLLHNAVPARLYMGDAGSYFLGYCLAVVTMQGTYAGYRPGTWHATWAPVLIMAVPLYDLLSVVWIRIREGRSPFHADRRHFSHRLAARGVSRAHAVTTIHLLSMACGLSAVLLHRVDVIGAWLMVGLVGCVLGVIAMLEHGGGPVS